MTTDFKLLARDGAARRGILNTAHGPVNTPAFMPVGTQATVKGMLPESVAMTGAEILLGNTYHLMLRPGAERVARLGGLHRFMNWPGPILTDSGGFQVMSLSGLRSLDDDGVTFRSHLDGSSHRLTPERSIEIQNCLDADITMCFDECTPWPATEAQAAHSMRLSMRWARRCREAFVDRPGSGLFGIVQGSMPTRSGRTGQGFTRRGTVNIRNARHADDPRPLDSECRCPACRHYGRAYLHHLFRANEMLGPILLTWHNLAYFQDLMAGLREAIEAGRLADFAAAFERRETEGDIEPLVAVDAADDEPLERPDRGQGRSQNRNSQNRNHDHTRNQDRDDD